MPAVLRRQLPAPVLRAEVWIRTSDEAAISTDWLLEELLLSMALPGDNGDLAAHDLVGDLAAGPLVGDLGPATWWVMSRPGDLVGDLGRQPFWLFMCIALCTTCRGEPRLPHADSSVQALA
eukprot:352743-Chlamydomonas_euryale.AAC.2